MRRTTEPKRLPVRILSINKHAYTLMSRFGRIKGAFQAGQLNTVESKTLGLDIAIRWPDTGPKILLTQAVQLFNGRGTLASIQKAGRDIAADQVKANKLVVEALDSVAKWVAKLPPVPPATPAPRAAPVSPAPELAPASPTPEAEALPPRRGPRQGTKRTQAQVVESDSGVEAQILCEIEAIQTVEPVLGRGKRVKRSTK
jgi:hypothetical protein